MPRALGAGPRHAEYTISNVGTNVRPPPTAAVTDLSPRPERIAHRGAPRELPENTLPAFARAIERGADGIELDVHTTRDGVVVVHHDPALASGEVIAQTDWHERGVRGLESSPWVGVPTLADVFALTRGGRVRVYVEIKGDGITAAVVDDVQHSGMPERCALHSFDHEAIAWAARIAPQIRRGLLFDSRPSAGELARAVAATAALDVWPRWDTIDVDLVHEVHAREARVLAWTVNTTDAVRSLSALGVDGLCTDDVRIL